MESIVLKKESQYRSILINNLLMSLSPYHNKGKDGRKLMTKKMISLINRSLKEKIITESEANALAKYFIGKLLMNQFDSILERVFSKSTSVKNYLHS
jgi:hypothetical protein